MGNHAGFLTPPRVAIHSVAARMNTLRRTGCWGRSLIAAAAWTIGLAWSDGASAQSTRPSTRPTTLPSFVRPPSVDATLKGHPVEEIKVTGNTSVSTSVILNVVRTRAGEPFDPQTVEDDYQRIFGLRKFGNVEARVEPTATGGVIVIFSVAEQRQVKTISYLGNANISTIKLKETVDLREGESLDRFRIAIARQSIERLYRENNYPLAHVDFDSDRLATTGEVVFVIVEGPNVRIRKVNFRGNQSFEKDTLKDKIRSSSWIFIFRNGKLDLDQVDDDVAALRRFYESKGFFDVRVGRRVRFSADQTECQVDYLVDEGKRYVVDKIIFKGNTAVQEDVLKRDLKLQEGMYFDDERRQRDVRQLVKEYSPFGYVYQPQGSNPDYLKIDTRTLFKHDIGKVDLVYDISEGKPFRVGRVLVKGNTRTQDKVVIREMRVNPGQLYNSSELQDATDRLRTSPYFSAAQVTPIGEDPENRDVLVEVTERQTASFLVGAGVNSNGGVSGNLTYEQKNFDITSPPDEIGDLFSDRAYTGAGQRFKATLSPGTQFNDASILFSEPFIFDQAYSFTGELYYRDRNRPDYVETRIGGRTTFGKRLDFENSIGMTLKAEAVEIHNIENAPLRAPEILDLEGTTPMTTVAFQYRRDTTNRGIVPYKGSTFVIGTEQAVPPGDYSYNKVSGSYDIYKALDEDLLDRKTVLSIHTDVGYIFGDSPFFDNFYAGGIGSIRGFKFRGVSPRSGLEDDAIGGSFIVTSSAELSFPLAGDYLRYVFFADVGDVETDLSFGTIRSAVGFGFRMSLPFFGDAPLALDFAAPITKNDQDQTQVVSFSFGFFR